MKVSRVLLAVAVCGSLTLSACGSDDSSSPDSSTPTSDGQISEADIEIGLTYTAGTAGAADDSLEPVTIGFVSQQGGTPSFPEHEAAADAAVAYVNEELGGIDGHPVVLEKCVIQAEEDGQKCAAQLLANDAIDITNFALSVYGNETFYKTVDGAFPVIISAPAVAADYDTAHVYELDAGGDGQLASMAQQAADLGWKNVSIVSSDNPAGKFITGEVLVPNLESLGLDATAVYISDTSTTPDFVSALQSSGAAEADGVMLIPVAPASCVGLYQAMQQLSLTKEVVSLTQCSNDPMPEITDGGPEGWYLTSLSEVSLLDTPEATMYRDVMTAQGASDTMNVGHSVKGFGDILSIAKWGNEIGYDNLSPESFEQAILEFRGPAFMVPGEIVCGGHPTYKGICGDQAPRVAFIDGKWTSQEPFQVVELAQP